MKQNEQEFLSDLDKHLWIAADKLRANLDSADYKHVALGLIFLKNVSNAFKEGHAQLKDDLRDPKHDYYLGDDDSHWQYGIPPVGNANFAWKKHMAYHLAPNGSLGLLLANGSMSSNTNNEYVL